ncbi:DUF4180 domain-containing protein [Acutalibacter sp. 1XD8-33]|uniref:DUF4180 domain-containing protein n=1 Tax=Acutalibacter sp. 1XD8-33 TaxID=2320081 RepID=UPI000EA07AE2|nr:DUF4180 domain-containing protein [Acutalibacter sp. 1XD8-33]RKJ40283.1 DUF4180 domain-containing protein [Acutalibacter sp. 1XD8-33]
MTIRKLTENGVLVALVEDEGKLITGPQEALDLAMTVKYETGAQRLVLPKRLVAEEFFILSSGMAGEILQKYVNYQIKLAVFLGGSRYTSKPLHDFIYESNQGRDFFFVETEEEAVRRLTEAI